MEERRPKRIRRRIPARRKHHEVERVRALLVERCADHGVHRRIAMIEARVADRRERVEVVDVRHVVAMPCDDVERRVILTRLVELAAEDNVILRAPDGRQYVLAAIDDFAEEVARVGQNESLMQLLAERSRETTHLPLSQVREQLQGKKRSQRKGPGK